jgi:hypothetical protein
MPITFSGSRPDVVSRFPLEAVFANPFGIV